MITITEVFKNVLRQRGEEAALIVTAHMKQGKVIPMIVRKFLARKATMVSLLMLGAGHLVSSGPSHKHLEEANEAPP